MKGLHLYRWLRRRLREAIADNQWVLPTAGLLTGVLLSMLVGTGNENDPGKWAVTVDRSRDTLMSALGLVFTALSIVLALASVAAQNVVGRFGSRVLRIYSRRNADRWVIGTFAMAASFILVEQYQLRALESDALAPGAGLTISILLLVLTGILMIWYIASLLRWVRADQAVAAITEATLQAVRAVERHRRDAVTAVSIPPRPEGTTELLAPASGHLAEVDSEALLEVCGQRDAMVVITCRLGEPVVKNQPIGWIEERGSNVEGISVQEISGLIDVSGTRELGLSIEYGVVALVDIAIMALSPAVNDPNTAAEVIEAMSFLFAEIAESPLGPFAVPDPDTWPRVVHESWTFGELVELATTQIVDYGLSDSVVAQALQRFARSLQLLELSERDQAYVDDFAASLVTADL